MMLHVPEEGHTCDHPAVEFPPGAIWKCDCDKVWKLYTGGWYYIGVGIASLGIIVP